MKRVVSLLLFVLIIVGSLTVPAAAATEAGGTWGDFEWTLDTEGTLIISGEGDMDAVYNGGPWGDYSSEIKTIVINNGVTSIGYSAFRGCTSLTSITIPDSVTSIGDNAFSGCTSLTSITIPDSVTSIGYSAFSGCTSLTSITIPESVTNIGLCAFHGTGYYNDESNWENGALYIDYRLISVSTDFEGELTIKNGTKIIADHAFYQCTSLTSVNIPTSVTSIGNCAFAYCIELTDIFIPNSVISIGNYAFGLCRSLTDIIISEGVINIDDRAFENCSSLTSITIPAGVASIGDSVFFGCNSLAKIEVDANNNSYCDIDGVLYDKNLTTIIRYPEAKANVSCEIANGVESISAGAFDNCIALESVTIPSGVKSIGIGAFRACSSLKSVILPNGVKTIEDWAFYGCVALTEITIPDSVTSIFPYSFYYTGYYNDESNWENGALYIDNCLIKVNYVNGDFFVKNGTVLIADNAFSGSSFLANITIPNSVTSIGAGAFVNCNRLNRVYYGGSKVQWKQIDIVDEGNLSLNNANIEFALSYTKGDVNGDGEVDNLDAATILKYDAGILENIIETIADVNNDGVADNLDAAMILKYDAGIIESL